MLMRRSAAVSKVAETWTVSTPLSDVSLCPHADWQTHDMKDLRCLAMMICALLIKNQAVTLQFMDLLLFNQ